MWLMHQLNRIPDMFETLDLANMRIGDRKDRKILKIKKSTRVFVNINAKKLRMRLTAFNFLALQLRY